MKGLIWATTLCLLASTVVACSSGEEEKATPTGAVAPPASTEMPTGTVTPPVETETPRATVTPPVETKMPSGAVTPPRAVPLPYDGPVSLEERTLKSPVIARVRLDSVSSAAESGNTYQGTKYIALLEFSFSVEEYLKGSGADDIVAVWAAAPFFDTEKEAEDALPAIAAARDAQWDSREAIVFLQTSELSLPSTQQANRYYLAWAGTWMNYGDNDAYSLASRHNRLWLPAAAAVGEASQATGDQQRFLMAVPPATGTAPTITLGEIKTRIGAVAAKLEAGDGSEAYTECVQRTYYYEGINSYRISKGEEGFFYRTPDQELASGLAASSVVYETLAYGGLPNRRHELWLDGGDEDLFRVEFSNGVPYDFSGDGTNDSIQYTQRVVSVRPLPAGVYGTHYNNRHVDLVPCEGYAFRHEWTVTVNAPAGTLHQAFFDPMTVGTAVKADATNGVLSPTSFTVGGTSTELTGLEWSNNQVVLTLGTHVSLSGHVLEFIDLSGNVALPLFIADAAVDSTAGTYSWTMTSQPWEDGDKLMVRIREDG